MKLQNIVSQLYIKLFELSGTKNCRINLYIKIIYGIYSGYCIFYKRAYWPGVISSISVLRGSKLQRNLVFNLQKFILKP